MVAPMLSACVSSRRPHPLALATVRCLRKLLLAGPMLAVAVASAASLRIVEPAPDQTLHDNAGRVTVRVVLEDRAQLPDTLRLRVLLDGRPVVEGHSQQVALTDVDRGSHQLQAQLIDADGNVIERSEPVRFHLWQASRLNRAAGR